VKSLRVSKILLPVKVAILLGLVAILITACQHSLKLSPDNGSGIRVVKDDLGREVRLPLEVKRAVSLAPNITEMVFAVGAGDRLVGDTTYCNYPEEAKSIEKVGDTLNPNIETIVRLKPDIVFVSGASQLENFTNVLQQNGIVVFVLAPNSIADVLSNLRQLGSIFSTEQRTDQVIVDLQKRVDGVEQKLFHSAGSSNADHKPVRVFVQISKEPLFTIGKRSYLTKMLESADAVSLTADVDSGYPKLSKETALALDPEVIILSDSSDNTGPSDAFRNSPAVVNGRVYKVNADLLSRPGPRLVNALEQIAEDLHPEKFK
jgi:iron complex transport system substrate-binding protein